MGIKRDVIFGVVLVLLQVHVGQTHDEGKLFANVKERLKLLERRVSTEINMLRDEFYNELALIPIVSAVKDNDVANPNHEKQELHEEFEKRVVDSLNAMKNGFGKEKLFRRDLQKQIGEIQADQADKDVHRDDLLNTLIEKVESIAGLLTHTFGNVNIAELSKLLTISQTTRAVGPNKANDCVDLYNMGHVTSGVYSVYPASLWRPLDVYCDMETDGGGWTVFQRRCDGSEDFYRSWIDYRFGFGNLSREFWLGNEYIHRLVSRSPHELRIELEDFENDKRYAKYLLFTIGGVEDGFRLSIEGFQGNVTDTFENSIQHNGKEFSTKDKGPSIKCARDFKGGFWYGGCHSVNINGQYLKGKHESYADGVNFSGFRGQHYSLKFTEIKFRSK